MGRKQCERLQGVEKKIFLLFRLRDSWQRRGGSEENRQGDGQQELRPYPCPLFIYPSR